MPVDNVHPDYAAALPSWSIVRDCVAGERAVKRRGDAYLPKLRSQTDAEYRAYVHRARFFGATGRTLKAFVGFIYSKDPNFEFSADLDDFMLDATLSGVTWYDYCKSRCRDALSIGRSGTFIDWNLLVENRAYACHYSAEDIINWKTARINGRTVLSMLVLHELKPAQDINLRTLGDEYSHDMEDHWRVYRLIQDDGGNPYVWFEEFRRVRSQKIKGGPVRAKRVTGQLSTPMSASEFELVDQAVMTRRGIPLTRIPFVFHNALDGLPDVGAAPLEDIANINISHYMTSADLEHGRHFCGLPTPIAAGFEIKKGEALFVGSAKAWIAAKADAKGYYMEFTGSGLAALEKAISEKESQMAALGARMLESQSQGGKGNAEAFETVQIRQSAETSALRDTTLAMSASLSLVMQWIEWYHGTAVQPEDLEGECNVRLNTEFVQTDLDPATLGQMWAGYTTGAYSYEELFYKLQRGGLIRDDTTIDQERAAIASSPIATMGNLMLEDKKTAKPTDKAAAQ